jgi:hypothetical protein
LLANEVSYSVVRNRIECSIGHRCRQSKDAV